MKHDVSTQYDAANFPVFDDILYVAVGRLSDASGMGFGKRDHIWACASEIEAHGIAKKIRALGLTAEIEP